MPQDAPLHTPGPLLATIDSPADVRALPVERLPQLCDELRDFIVDIVAVHGGHFGASLGVVELTVALHWAYDTPEDQLVWDVGHQAYGHKILTGRRQAFPSNRTYGGLSGFPKRSESEYDTFGVGHASTSISAALGMAVARDLQKSDRKVVAVIGDGSMTGGLAFEGLNNAGAADTDLLVVLNDNRISIDPNVGALHEYLAGISSSKGWNSLKSDVWDAVRQAQGQGRRHAPAAGRPRGGRAQGGLDARDAVRGAGLPLHRPGRRPRRGVARAAAHRTSATSPARSCSTR